MILLLLCILLLGACQNNNLFDNHTITSMKIEDWDSEEDVTTITDEDLIQDLVKGLNSAQTNTTADMDLPNPDYRLLFLDRDKVTQELGYYIEKQNFGVMGRYTNFSENQHYALTTKLPIEMNDK